MEIINDEAFENRKKDHIRCSLSDESQSLATEDWNRIHLIPEALPEIDFEEVSLEVQSLGRTWSCPFFVSSMTGGHSDSLKINSVLAEVCQEKSWLLGVGSQRRELDDSSAPKEWKTLRRSYPRVMLASNIGLSQLIQVHPSKIQELIEHTEAVALFIHTNPLQECLQQEGTPQFRGGLKAIERICRELTIPVVVKEVGSGVSPSTIQKLKNAGVKAVDVSGRGGTHWGRVEGLRSPKQSLKAEAAETFKDWGVSTPMALYAWAKWCANATVDTTISNHLEMEVWASGGIRNGLQAAKSLALGAQRVGLARPFLETALMGSEAVAELMTLLEYELKMSLFCLGIKNLSELKQRKVWQWET